MRERGRRGGREREREREMVGGEKEKEGQRVLEKQNFLGSHRRDLKILISMCAPCHLRTRIYLSRVINASLVELKPSKNWNNIRTPNLIYSFKSNQNVMGGFLSSLGAFRSGIHTVENRLYGYINISKDIFDLV